MGEAKEKEKKPSKFSQLKAEFQKIIWPDKMTVTKQTVVVIIMTVILGVIISILDFVFKYGMDFLLSL